MIPHFRIWYPPAPTPHIHLPSLVLSSVRRPPSHSSHDLAAGFSLKTTSFSPFLQVVRLPAQLCEGLHRAISPRVQLLHLQGSQVFLLTAEWRGAGRKERSETGERGILPEFYSNRGIFTYFHCTAAVREIMPILFTSGPPS